MTITTNEKLYRIDMAPDTPLLWVLRDAVGLTGTKYGCGMGLCGACIDESRRRELRSSKLESQITAAQLEVLRAQIHPHFLFNTLQAATTLIHEDPEGAEDILQRLSELLRLSVDGSHVQEIALERELEVLDLYIGIQARRFGDRLHFEISVDQSVRHCVVPSLILQPLVENAIRHGIGKHKGTDTISIRGFQRDGLVQLGRYSI